MPCDGDTAVKSLDLNLLNTAKTLAASCPSKPPPRYPSPWYLCYVQLIRLADSLRLLFSGSTSLRRIRDGLLSQMIKLCQNSGEEGVNEDQTVAPTASPRRSGVKTAETLGEGFFHLNSIRPEPAVPSRHRGRRKRVARRPSSSALCPKQDVRQLKWQDCFLTSNTEKC